MTSKTKLRTLLAGPDAVVAPGAFDGLTAMLVEEAGFPAVYMTGAGVSASYGLPDYGLLGLAEMAGRAGLLAGAVAIPVIADADTGYGNELNVTRTVREYEARGVAALHIEDQVSPKRCGHLAGKEVVSREEFVAKIRAAAAARRDPDTFLIARTDARAVIGLEEAVARANAALEAGADMAFVEAARTAEEAAAIPGQVRGPCLLNMVYGGLTPVFDVRDAKAMGYRLVIAPALVLGTVVSRVAAALAEMRANGLHPEIPGRPRPQDLFQHVGSARWDALRNAFEAGSQHERGAA